MQKRLVNLFRLILSDQNTRNLFFFLLINFCFAFVELFYGLWTNSLGLISDSFHMFFDCSALVLGLVASLMTKWRPTEKFSYGFGRAEVLAGLANGLFLLFIAMFIMKEAIERTFEPPEVHHERLFVVSVLGFLVNLIGIFVFQHGGQGHHHGHGSCSHSHSHSPSSTHNQNHHHNHDHHSGVGDNSNYSHFESSSPIVHSKSQANVVVSLDMNGLNNHHQHDNHRHHHHDQNHGDDHHHPFSGSYDNQPLIDSGFKTNSTGRGHIMQSVFLHIVADTLGSVGVMISALLMNQFGWLIADPICSIFIATLISISVYPLLRDSMFVLMQRVPVELEQKLPACLLRIQQLQGVLSVHDTHFWTLNSDNFVGSLKLEVSQNADARFIMSQAKTQLNQIGVNQSNIQVDLV